MNDPKWSLTHCGTKGQIISKGHFGVFNSSKKQTKTFRPCRLWLTTCFPRNQQAQRPFHKSFNKYEYDWIEEKLARI